MTVTRAHYDRRAFFYDQLIGSRLYQRLFWGTSTGAFTRFAERALAASPADPFLEAGCGSLLFTADLYEKSHPRAVLVDRSIEMLKRGARKLARHSDATMVHADLAALPLPDATFGAVLCLNVLHVPCAAPAIIAELGRALVPGGRLFLTSLVLTGRWSDAYLRLLGRLGELAPARTPDELRALVVGSWGGVESFVIEGNMAFVVVRHGG